MLKTLEYSCKTDLGVNLPQIRLNSLGTLKLKLENRSDYDRSLRAMKCNPIKTLKLENCFVDDDELITEICTFKMLVTLRLPCYSINPWYLTKLKMLIDEPNAVHKICSTLSILPKLTKLTIVEEEVGVLDGFISDFKKSAYDIYACLTKTNTEIKIANDCDSVFVSKDYILLYLENLLEVHWMDHLNEMNVRQVMNREWVSVFELKFINN